MSIFKKLKTTLVLILFFLFSNFLFATGNNTFSIKLQANKQQTNTSVITVTITNVSSKALRMLKWNTPLEPTFNANLFNIYNNNKKVVYTGRVVKRGAPQEKDFILLQAGESVNATVQLDAYYNMSVKGNYNVHYRSNINFKEENLKKQSTPLKLQKTKNIKSSVEINYIPSSQKTISQKVAPNYDTCSASQIIILNDAHDAAINISTVASQDLLNEIVPTSAERYVEWFGVADTSRHNTVNTHFSAILSALDEEQIAFDCTCTDDYYAYVYPSQPYMIYLCNAFWTANLTGTDSQAGTIVHETSHFTIVAGTDDYAYGHTLAKELAVSNPDQAVFNADSHEYFAENTPVLSMDPIVPDPDDYGNIIDDAYLLTFSESVSITGIIEAGSDTDVFALTVPSAGTLSIFTTGTLDTIGTLYDQNSVQLAYNDDEAASVSNFKITQEVSPGQHYISVASYSTNTGDYTLNIEFTPSDPIFTPIYIPTIISYLLN